MTQIQRDVLDFLQQSVRIPSVSGLESDFVHFVENWSRGRGFETDLWFADEDALGPLGADRHIPLKGRPTLVVRLPGTGSGGRSVLFNAHSDVVSAPGENRWANGGPWSGAVVDGAVYGRGACDVKGPLASAMLALLQLRDGPKLGGDVFVEIVPGEEDCVGLGTMTSVARGYKADAAVILEPTEGQPRCASRGGCRFEIEIPGRSVHGTVKWLGLDAIRAARTVLDRLDRVEEEWNDRTADPLFASYPYARPITVDSIHGGEWQGMTCDLCKISGYLELLPADDIAEKSEAFQRALGVPVRFTETYNGHRTDPASELCQAADESVEWQAFNSGCEAGLRWKLHDTPTLVWGPGSLAQAHAVDEFVRIDDVIVTAARLERFVGRWVR